jgi:hypothetical protein
MAVLAWRHPRPMGAEGRCIGGRTDLAVDARKAKRLAHRIRAVVRREGLVREVVCSPLERCRAVGRCLRRLPGPMLITHGGWLSATLWRPTADDRLRPCATSWPLAPPHGVLVRLD